MRKIIYLFITAVLVYACSATPKERTNATTSRFFSYYNTLFNGVDAFEEETATRKKTFKDNFYDAYIALEKTEANNPSKDDENKSLDFGGNLPSSRNKVNRTTNLDIVEAKAQKAITNYSVMKNGIQKNKMLFDAYLLLAKARLYSGKSIEALDALRPIFTTMKLDKRLPLANIIQGKAYTDMKDYYRAEEVFLALKNQKIKKKYNKILSLYYAELLLASGKKNETIDELATAFVLNKNAELRSRIAYLRGQLLMEQNKLQEARSSFQTAYRYASDYEFEVKSQLAIAKSFDKNKDNYEDAKSDLENISKKGTYNSRKNELYYALGILAQRAGKDEDAKAYFKKSLDEKSSDPQIRGFTYYETAQSLVTKKDYIAAGAYYDSAVAIMTYKPEKDRLTDIAANIKELSKNFYLVKKNDSILNLVHMSPAQQTEYFNKYIDELKKKEAKLMKEQQIVERNKGFESTDFKSNAAFSNNNISSFTDFSVAGQKGGFYFANTNTVSRGVNDFKRIWGNRALVDNWRSSIKSATIEDVKNEAMGTANTKDPRRLEASFYIEKLPQKEEEISLLKKSRDTASLGLGRMYESFFGETEVATKTLFDLVAQKPEPQVKQQALYLIFKINNEKNIAEATKAKNMILTEFPDSSFAEYVKNPKVSTLSASKPEVLQLYINAFEDYKNEDYNKSQEIISNALERFPKDALVPKFTLLNAFNTGKIAGKEVMILQLDQLSLNYPETSEGKKAKEILAYLKGDAKKAIAKKEIEPNNPTPTEQPQPDSTLTPPPGGLQMNSSTSEEDDPPTPPRRDPSSGNVGPPQRPRTP